MRYDERVDNKESEKMMENRLGNLYFMIACTMPDSEEYNILQAAINELEKLPYNQIPKQ